MEVKLERSLGWLQMSLPQMAWEKGMDRLVDGGWQLEKLRYCWLLVGLMWTEVQNADLSTNMSISRKVTWEGVGKSDRIAQGKGEGNHKHESTTRCQKI